jgi:uncharacterized protein with ACT and thioredoxin-like domain
MLIVHNDDRPGMIGIVGTLLGQQGVNISDMAVGVHPDGNHAVMAITTGEPAPEALLERLRASDGILEVRAISLA